MDIARTDRHNSAAGWQDSFRWQNLQAVGVRGVRKLFRLRSGATWTAAIAFIALLWCGPAQAETRVYLLRGWFGVFSTGMDELAAELKAKGIKAEAIGHLSWKSTVSKIVKDRASGKSFALALVGHSQGANNVIEMAQALETHKIAVDILVTLAPMLQEPVPPNVVRAMNYYQNPGWGAPLVAGRGFHGKLSNIDVSSDLTITHINIDKKRPGPGGNCAGDPRHPAAEGEPAVQRRRAALERSNHCRGEMDYRCAVHRLRRR
jgi:hypothetical protein